MPFRSGTISFGFTHPQKCSGQKDWKFWGQTHKKVASEITPDPLSESLLIQNQEDKIFSLPEGKEGRKRTTNTQDLVGQIPRVLYPTQGQSRDGEQMCMMPSSRRSHYRPQEAITGILLWNLWKPHHRNHQGVKWFSKGRNMARKLGPNPTKCSHTATSLSNMTIYLAAFRLPTTGNFFHLTNDFFFIADYVCTWHWGINRSMRHGPPRTFQIAGGEICAGKNSFCSRLTERPFQEHLSSHRHSCNMTLTFPPSRSKVFLAPYSPFWSPECSRSDPWKIRS